MNRAAALKRIDAYERLIRLDKPIGALLLLWPTLWAVWIAAAGRPLPEMVAIFVAGTILMRSAGCAINDWADRDFDGKVARTRDRPLAAGEIPPKEALVVGAAFAAAAFPGNAAITSTAIVWRSLVERRDVSRRGVGGR